MDRDQLLTTVTITWLNAAGASSAHFVYETMHAENAWAGPGTDSDDAGDQGGEEWAAPTVPTGVAVFAADNSIRSRIDSGNVTRWTEYDSGGHFPAMEVPDLLVADVRAFFAGVR